MFSLAPVMTSKHSIVTLTTMSGCSDDAVDGQDRKEVKSQTSVH